ncbi:MAG: phenylalanine--tRNA ligase subunit alpha [Chitinispirillaceae bacterium]|jgi:phenylalanyl-tRNA synthetase alpha chain
MSDHLKQIEEIRKNALEELTRLRNAADIDQFRVKYLGRKGVIKDLYGTLKEVGEEIRREFGQKVNDLRTHLEAELEKLKNAGAGRTASGAQIDYGLPGYPLPCGSLHPLMKIRSQIRDIFIGMGFTVAYGPDIETDHYNFEALNFKPDHPARDMQDTFHVSADTAKTLLRTHTSPVQIRVMEKQKPPIRCIMPGRVYRHEEISSRSYCLFHQVEGLYIDENVSFADLKGTLTAFSRAFFDEKTRLKIRPSFFPFTEPSVEIDVECFLCKGKGCSICKQGGWLEILGAGMVHPNVLKNVNIDSEKYTGFAFGMGIERIALLKYGIDDIRLFYENDVRFLRQF